MLQFTNVVVIAAHPDDEVLGAGGTIARLAHEGVPVTVAVVTDGSTTQYVGDDAILERKSKSLVEAARILGVRETVHWNFPDMRLDTVEHVVLNRAIEELIEDTKCDTIFVHHAGDVNLDHQLVHRSVAVATRPHPGQPVKNVLTYEVNSSTEWGARAPRAMFWANFFVDISATIQPKLRALECYTDELREFPHPRSVIAVEARARVNGSAVGCEFAEAFHLMLGRVPGAGAST